MASTTLSNADFQQFVSAIPRPEFDDDDDLFDPQSAKGKRRSKIKQPIKKNKSRVKWEEKKKEKKNVYRDRAKEMREGLSNEYTGDRNPENYDAEMRQRSAYLGGDVEHTHLVEGLDRVLLKQRRDELDAEESAALNITRKDNKTNNQYLKLEKDKIKFKTNIGRRVHNLIFPIISKDKPKKRKLEIFLPGRMIFEFNLDPRDIENIPTTITRSSEDCPQFEDLIAARLKKDILSDAKQIFYSLRTGRHGHSKKAQKNLKEENLLKDKKNVGIKSALKNKTQILNDDDNIFEGVGSYMFQPKIEKSLSKTKKGAFGDKNISHMEDSHHRSMHQKSHNSSDSRRTRIYDKETNRQPTNYREANYSTDNERKKNDHSKSYLLEKDKYPRDSSPPKLRSILRKKPVSAVQLAEETAANLARRNKMSVLDRVKLENEDPFNLESFYDKEAKKFRVKAQVGMGLVSREVADPYETYSSANTGILLDDDSDNEENWASRKRRRLQNPPSKAAQMRMEKRRLDKELNDVTSVMKRIRRGL